MMKKSRSSCNGSGLHNLDGREVEPRLSPRRSKRIADSSTSSSDSPHASCATASASYACSQDQRSTSSHEDSSHNLTVAWNPAVHALTDEGSAALAAVLNPPSTSSDSIAIRCGLLQTLRADGQLAINCTPTSDADSAGLWGRLPEELIEIILKQCSPTQLGKLESTCHFFHDSKIIPRIAKHKLKAVPRARGLRPCTKQSESYTMLLHYVTCQSAAAAQATSIACGAYHTAALLIPSDAGDSSDRAQRHNLYTFGRGFHGQLGNNAYESKSAPTQVSLGFKVLQETPEVEEETMPAVVACGSHHSTAISRKGELYSWGLGCNGELGLGRWGPIELSIPRQCSSPSVRIVSVACGANHTLAIAETGTLWSCGKNRHGQLGNSTVVDGSRLQMVMNLSGYRIVSSAAGEAHSLALASDGSLFSWGDGSRGQLGHSQLQGLAAMIPANTPVTMPSPQRITRLDPAALSPENRVTAIAAGAHHSMALTVGGAILVFGANEHGQLGTGDQLDRWKPTRINLALPGEESTCLRVVQLSCGHSHSVALFSIHGVLQVRSTGCNSHGQLGLGDRADRVVFTPVRKLQHVVAIQAGDEHSVAVTLSGELFLWGRGDCGQLGLGESKGHCKPTLLKGYQVVHPDKTLRRNKRSQPSTRPVQQDARDTRHAGSPCM